MKSPKFIMMVGIVASGKSTYAKLLATKENAILLSSDQLRLELYNDINNMENNSIIFKTIRKQSKEYLRQNKNVIIDATNISYKKRKAFLDELKKINCTKECYLMATPYEICLKQNKLRDRHVPEGVIKNMYKSIYVPQYFEGWNKIHIIYNTGDIKFGIKEFRKLFEGLYCIDQDNPHHTLTIGSHCDKCLGLLINILKDNVNSINKTNDIGVIEGINLAWAAQLHDIGKKFTKQFKNSKGEDTEIAHYYNHQLVSAYDSLFYLKGLRGHTQEDILNIVQYITFHMQPYFIKTEKSKNKFIKLVGQDFYDNLMMLNQADKLAK